MLRPNPITGSDAELLRRKVAGIGLTPWAGHFEAMAQHGIALCAAEPGEEPFSRSGCAPTVPPGFVWPHHPAPEGDAADFDDPDDMLPTPYAFIAQFDLAELAEADVHHILPPKGLLYFFFPDPEGYGGRDRAEVLFYPDAEAGDTVEYDMTDPMIAAYTRAWECGPHQYIDEEPVLYRAIGRASVAGPPLWALERQGAGIPPEVLESVRESHTWDLDLDPERTGLMTLLGTERVGPGEYGGRGMFEPWNPDETMRLLFSPGTWLHSGCPAYFLISDRALREGDFSAVEVITPQC
ncbi:DUF1963 domain-containing protein [Streptomyces atratus]|uniref:DUF1963 domain-containing protein n=1 Tax=Streptomyces atratus TaxID=1893 RepID=UPI002251763E|nr:DUF1963 domain-containing protein [Streptomyces atratus]MCX5341988.1 YwqG family protein [Streptomyces atratus]